MDFDLTEEQAMLVDSTATLMRRHAPASNVHQWDMARTYPDALYAAWADAGLLQLPFPTEIGGLGGDAMDVALLVEEISRTSADLCMPFSSAIFCGLNILRNGSDAQIAEWLPPIMSGRKKMLIAISEPGAGSDVGAMTSYAEQSEAGYRINGQKLWVTGAGLNNAMLSVYVKTDRTVSHRDGLSMFLIENDAPGGSFPEDGTVFFNIIVDPVFLFRMDVRDNTVDPTVEGAGIDSVGFSISGNGIDYFREERTAGFCVFGGGEPTCNPWPRNEFGQLTWGAGGPVVQSGEYFVNMTVTADRSDDDFGGNWNWNFNFRVTVP